MCWLNRSSGLQHTLSQDIFAGVAHQMNQVDQVAGPAVALEQAAEQRGLIADDDGSGVCQKFVAFSH